jgi:5-methyltetrahydrofolate--homocysteine methyltransferase
MNNDLLATLEKRPLLCDGATGTQLMAAGLEHGACGELWNLEHPERVLAVHKKYVEAGSDCIITNTFGGNRITLDRRGLGDRVVEINRAAVKIARDAFGGKPGFVFGGTGPSGCLLKPLGKTDPNEVLKAFTDQIKVLVEAGVDAIIIETMTSLDELILAIRAAQQAQASCIIGSLAYDAIRGGEVFRTVMGVKPEQAAEAAKKNGAHLIGMNCGTGVDIVGAAAIVGAYRSACNLPIIAQPNAGKPELIDGETVYKETAEEMARGVAGLLEAGARIIGACCGSTPDHICAMRKALNERL